MSTNWFTFDSLLKHNSDLPLQDLFSALERGLFRSEVLHQMVAAQQHYGPSDFHIFPNEDGISKEGASYPRKE